MREDRDKEEDECDKAEDETSRGNKRKEAKDEDEYIDDEK